MAILKAKQARELSDEELQKKLLDFQKELNIERGTIAAGGRSSNTAKIRQLKRAIARILTILHERKNAQKSVQKNEKK
jgi:ribosomal protein L29